jgi:glutamate-1-semialdehyde 2,1-aminomutase
MFGGRRRLGIAVSRTVRKVAPCAEPVHYSGSGTKAVQAALRQAQAHAGRNRFNKFEGHDHGWMDSGLYGASPPLKQMGPLDSPNAVPMSAGQSQGTALETIVPPWNDLEVLEDVVNRHFGVMLLRLSMRALTDGTTTA